LINRVLPEPSAALPTACCWDRSSIPADLYEAYRTAGVAHRDRDFRQQYLAAGRRPGLSDRAAVRTASRRAACVIGVLLYVLLAGAQPPAVRAGLMAVLF